MSMTEEQRADAKAAQQAAYDRLLPHLERYKTLITHHRGGCHYAEHIFQGFDGLYLTGYPTSETIRMEHHSGPSMIAPDAVTHLNRSPVEYLDEMDVGDNDDPGFPFDLGPDAPVHAMKDEIFHRIRAVVRSVTRQLGDGQHDALHHELTEALSALDDIADLEASVRAIEAGTHPALTAI